MLTIEDIIKIASKNSKREYIFVDELNSLLTNIMLENAEKVVPIKIVAVPKEE
jgi:hypothetical protein